MQPSGDAPRIPLQSVSGTDTESTRAARLRIYLNELERQARIFNRSYKMAWAAAFAEPQADPDEADVVWLNLQSALFAAIVVQRVLQPGVVRRYPHHANPMESREQSRDRGRDLCELLGVPDDAALFEVKKVRDSFEHVDERLDSLMRPGVTSIADWYVSHGVALTSSTSSGVEGAVGYGLRVFYAPAGLLYFDEDVLDMHAVDIAMLHLRQEIVRGRETLAAEGGGKYLAYGGQRLVQLLPGEVARDRTDGWLEARSRYGHPLGVVVDWPDQSE